MTIHLDTKDMRTEEIAVLAQKAVQNQRQQPKHEQIMERMTIKTLQQLTDNKLKQLLKEVGITYIE